MNRLPAPVGQSSLAINLRLTIVVCAYAVIRDTIHYRLNERKGRVTFQAPTLASLGMITVACVLAFEATLRVAISPI
jgi:hypothetical protein